MSRIHVGPELIDVAAVTAEVMGPGNGGVATFFGTVRDSVDGRRVTALEYSAYIEMAVREMATIVREAEALADHADVVAVHRVGELDVGDVCVGIAAGHAHRAPAFEAARYVIEQIKIRVPIWKREHYADGTREWVNCSSGHEGAGSARVDTNTSRLPHAQTRTGGQ